MASPGENEKSELSDGSHLWRTAASEVRQPPRNGGLRPARIRKKLPAVYLSPRTRVTERSTAMVARVLPSPVTHAPSRPGCSFRPKDRDLLSSGTFNIVPDPPNRVMCRV